MKYFTVNLDSFSNTTNPFVKIIVIVILYIFYGQCRTFKEQFL